MMAHSPGRRGTVLETYTWIATYILVEPEGAPAGQHAAASHSLDSQLFASGPTKMPTE
jgi:hypothetical protein